MENYSILIATSSHYSLCSYNMKSCKSSMFLTFSLKLEIIFNSSNKSWMHAESSYCIFFLYWKNEFDFSITHFKNSHLVFLWFMFSLKQPCVLLFLVHFIPKALWENGHRLSYYLFNLCISVHSKSWAWRRNVYFFPMGTSKKWKKVTARQCALSERATKYCICFSCTGQYMDTICHWNNVTHLYCTSSVELKALYGHSH